jgi:dTDP-4-dehydrorhamnose reductase
VNKHKIIVSGKDGQLGWELMQIAPKLEQNFEFIFIGRQELDLTQATAIEAFIKHHQPTYFINCAAYTAVDMAETDTENAAVINTAAPKKIASTCEAINCKLIHISTDYVFDGEKKKPYNPTDLCNPLNVYGLTKMHGEEAIAQSNCKSIIIRTSWVYSSHGKNFVKTMLRLMSDRKEINVVNDQIGNPTYAADLAKAILDIVLKDVESNVIRDIGKVYHYSNTGNISWFNFAQSIQQISNKVCIVNPIPSSSYPTPAKRSNYSVLDCTVIEEDFDIEILDWTSSLIKCLALLK